MGREPAQITPPSGLRVNRQSAVPVHAQLTTQIRHLIDTGGLKPGMQLPTLRQLAGFLRINRNTAARALGDLHKDGYLESRPARGPAERRPSGQPVKVRALLVECNWEELKRYRDELEAELPLAVDRLLVDELLARAQEPDFLKGYRIVITTFFHIHEVKRAVPADGPPTVALLSEASLSVLLRLTELPEGTTVGLVCTTSSGSQNLLRSVQSAGLSHLTPVLASTDDPWSISRMLAQTRTVVCSEQGAGRLANTLPPDVEG